MRHRELTGRKRDREQADERREHLDKRERERVVARREALHQDDLQRVDGGAREHEQVAGERPAMHAGEQREPDGREQHPDPHRERAIRVRKSASAISGVSTTYIPVTKPVLETVVRSSPTVWSA